MWELILVTICLLLFFAVNLNNVFRYHRGPSQANQPELPLPNSLIMGMLAAGTAVFFLDSVLYLLVGILNGLFSVVNFLDLTPLNIFLLQITGALLMTTGYAIFIWSVLTRGRYATSWTMSAQHRLVDWGPYRYVRHPSYLGYFLMFIGFFFMWPNLLALIPLVAIPGYVLATEHEELMLMKRFGEEYANYKRRVGRFLPRLRFRKY